MSEVSLLPSSRHNCHNNTPTRQNKMLPTRPPCPKNAPFGLIRPRPSQRLITRRVCTTHQLAAMQHPQSSNYLLALQNLRRQHPKPIKKLVKCAPRRVPCAADPDCLQHSLHTVHPRSQSLDQCTCTARETQTLDTTHPRPHNKGTHQTYSASKLLNHVLVLEPTRLVHHVGLHTTDVVGLRCVQSLHQRPQLLLHIRRPVSTTQPHVQRVRGRDWGDM